MKQIIRLSVLFLLFVWSGCSTDQQMMKATKKVKYQNITISSVDGKKQFRTINDLTPKMKPKLLSWYSWYHPHELHLTAGNFSGRLLDGEYIGYFSDNSMKEKGEYKMGLKHGAWMLWYANGQLKEVLTFRKGVRHGDYWSFDETGKQMSYGVFKKGVFVDVKKSAWKQFTELFKTKEKTKSKKPKSEDRKENKKSRKPKPESKKSKIKSKTPKKEKNPKTNDAE